MILYNPKANKTKANSVIAAFVFVNVVITAGIVYAIVVIIRDILNDAEVVWPFWTALGGIVTGIFLYWLLNKILLNAYDKHRESVNIKGYGIAMCECGHYYDGEDIQYSVDANSITTKIEEQGSTTTSTSKGNILIECNCKNCGKVRNDTIFGVELSQSTESVKRVFFTTNLHPTYKHKSTSNYASLEKEVVNKYERDMERAKHKMSYYELLGYTTKKKITEKRM